MPSATPVLYALLIGIDRYQPAELYSNLQGCVRDINLVADYLHRAVNLPSERLWMLTSPNLSSFDLASIRGEEPAAKKPHVLPTYANYCGGV